MGADMREYDLSESAFARGWRDTTKGAMHSWWFWLLEAGGGAAMGALNGWLGLVWVIGFFIAVYIGATAAAPIRQRNEARAKVNGLTETIGSKEEHQAAIDALSSELDWATKNLLLKRPTGNAIGGERKVDKWEAEYRAWYQRVSERLADRRFFTQSDQTHFDILGFVEPIKMTYGVLYISERVDALLSQLKMKFQRLRDVIAWAQQRMER